jgi:hypothetical protein
MIQRIALRTFQYEIASDTPARRGVDDSFRYVARVPSLNDATLCAREHGCMPRMRRRGDKAGALQVLRVLQVPRVQERAAVAKAAAVVAFISKAPSSD